MARIDIPSDSHSGSFSWLQYLKEDALKEDDRQWKLVDAVFIDEDRTYIKVRMYCCGQIPRSSLTGRFGE